MSTSPVTVTNNPEPFSTNEKRFSIPGTILRSKCPECGMDCEQDLGDWYLSYPKSNTPIEVTFIHETKDDNGKYHSHEWIARIILRITVEAAPDIASPPT